MHLRGTGVSALILHFVLPGNLPKEKAESVFYRQSPAMVSLHGRRCVQQFARRRSGMHTVTEIPPDPKTLLSPDAFEEKVEMLYEWFQGKGSVLALTGAGLSTDSGIPDYRGVKGSYHEGHKPIIHQEFIESESSRKRYWGRSMVGWSTFATVQPNLGHHALARLEEAGRIGVSLEDSLDFYEPGDEDEFYFGNGHRKLSVITQNVDALHRRAGSKHMLQLHGRGDLVKCMQCGTKSDRNEYQENLRVINADWLERATEKSQQEELRPDGDANLRNAEYSSVVVPSCTNCQQEGFSEAGFLKPDVVFFGDSVPRSRTILCQEAVEAADALLVVGTSLAVHSAFRHVRAASANGTPIAILNVGQTRAEVEGLDHILKIEAPIGETLDELTRRFKKID